MPAEEFFTPTSIASLAVAASAVNVTANALYRFAAWDQRRTAFLAGLVIAYLNVFIRPNPHWVEWIIAFFNGGLLFCTAMGLNDVTRGLGPAKPEAFLPDQEAGREPFFSNWHRRK